jgi:hypothetical protein
MWQTRFKAILVTAVLLGVGPWLFLFSWNHLQDASRLDQSAAVVEGHVIRSSSERLSKGGHSYTLVVEYIPANHAPITKEFDVDGGDFTTARETGKAKVTYVPEEPEISRVTHFAALPFQVLLALGGLMMLGGAGCLTHACLGWTRPGKR